MKNIFQCILIGALSLSAASTFAAQGAQYLLVLSKTDKNLVILDYSTLQPIASIPVEDDPHEIVVSLDQHKAFVSNPIMNQGGHKIHVVDLKRLKLEKVIDTFPFSIPHGLAIFEESLWFTAQGSKAVVRYSLKDNKAAEVFGTGQDFTHLIHVTDDQKKFYTTNVESGTLSIFEQKQLPPYMPPTGVLPPHAKPRTEWRQTLVHVGLGAEGFDVSPDGKELWTARPDGHVLVVDLDKEKIKDDLDSKVQGLHRLKFTPDGKSVAVVSVKTGDLLFYDVPTRQVSQKTNICHGAGIYMDQQSDRMFISCTSDDAVAVVNLSTRKEIKRIKIGRPDGITSAHVSN